MVHFALLLMLSTTSSVHGEESESPRLKAGLFGQPNSHLIEVPGELPALKPWPVPGGKEELPEARSFAPGDSKFQRMTYFANADYGTFLPWPLDEYVTDRLYSLEEYPRYAQDVLDAKMKQKDLEIDAVRQEASSKFWRGVLYGAVGALGVSAALVLTTR
jgi:hypothetical protein